MVAPGAVVAYNVGGWQNGVVSDAQLLLAHPAGGAWTQVSYRGLVQPSPNELSERVCRFPSDAPKARQRQPR
jgi:hypothetical protein